MKEHFQELFNENNRPKVVLLSVLVVVIVLGITFYSLFINPSVIEQHNIGSPPEVGVANHESERTDEYMGKKEAENEAFYNEAKNTPSGVNIPFIFNGEKAVEAKLEPCGCSSFNKEQLLEALNELGYSGTRELKAVQLGSSDIFVTNEGDLTDKKNRHLLFLGKKVRVNSEGKLMGVDGSKLEINNQEINLSSEGIFFNKLKEKIRLKGSLRTQEGVLFNSEGFLVTNPGLMQRISNSDLFITEDGQLVTLDGKPVNHLSKDVYLDENRQVLFKNNKPIFWANSSVYILSNGYLTDSSKKQFERSGILFSYTGVKFDNFGRLTDSLNSLSQFGDSALFLNENSQLTDEFGSNVLNYGSPITVQKSGFLTVNKSPLENWDGEQIRIDELGNLRVQKGDIQSGLIKTSKRIPFNSDGSLIKTYQLLGHGQSSVFSTIDGLLTDVNASSLQYKNGNDIYKDFSRKMENGLVGLIDNEKNQVTDLFGDAVYLSLSGEFVTANGKLSTIGSYILNADDKVINSDGTIDSDRSLKAIIGSDGNPLTINGKKVFENADGDLVYENGEYASYKGQNLRLNANGDIVNDFGEKVNIRAKKPSDETIRTKPSIAEAILDANGNDMMVNGRKVYKDDAGNLVFADGSAVTDAKGQALRVNKDGHIIDSQGTILDPQTLAPAAQVQIGRQITGDNGQLLNEVLDANGQVLTRNGKRVYKDEAGNLVYADGSAVLDDSGSRLTVDSAGNIINEQGEKVDAFNMAETVSTGEVINIAGKRAESVLDANGNAMMVNGRKVYKDDAGNLVFADGSAVTDAKGQALRVNKDGHIIDSQGTILDPQTLAPAAQVQIGRQITGENGQLLNEVLDANGQVLTRNGKRVYKDEAGNLVYADGSAVLDDSGSRLTVDSAGNIINEQGEKVDAFNMAETVSTGEVINIAGKRAESVLDANGNAMMVNGRKVYKDDAGNLVFADGSAVTDAKGQALRVNKDGHIIDSQGTILDPQTLAPAAQVQIGRQITGENGQLLNEVLDANGQVLTRNGKRVYKDEAGNLVYADGSAVLDDSGSRLTVDSAGNIINEQGEKVDAFNMAETVSTGEVINIAGKRAESVLDANGNAMMVNGRKVYKDDAGNLVFADGSAVTDAKGQALRVNKDGHIIDSQGTILDPQTLAPAAQVQIGRQITGENGQLLNEVLDANGQVLTRNGKRVYKDEAGNLVYADGSAVLDDSGSRLTVDSAGNIINEQGEKVDAFNMAETVSTGEVINIAGKRAESVLDANGNAMMVNGRKVYKDDAGNLVFADGSAVTDAKGQALRVNKDGHIIDSQGTILDPQTLAPAAQVQIGRQITGENGQLLNEVLDANGQVLTRNGKRVYKDEAGNLVYADGSAVLDDSGSRLTVDSAGNIINEQGEKVDAFNMAETVSTGEVINIAGKRAESVLDANGNAMMVNGRKVYKDDAGNLVFADGSAVTDAKGQALRVNKDGHIIDSQGTILDPQTLAPAAQVQIGSQITGENGQLLNEVLDANGQVLTRNGKRVYKDEAGNLVYADGSAVLDDSGSRLTVDSAGNIINEQGEKVDAFNMAETVSTGEVINIAGKRAESVLDANGNAMMVNGRKVYKDDAGNLVFADGSAVTDAKGQALRVNKDGHIIDSQGTILDPQTLAPAAQVQIGRQITGENGQLLNEVLDANGQVLTRNGKRVYKDEAGNLVYADGSAVLDDSGSRLSVDSAGNIINEQGEKVDAFNMAETVSTGEVINIAGKRAESVLDANGNAMMVNGRKVYKDDAGNLVFADGSAVTDAKGQALRVNKDGHIIDSQGTILDPQTLAPAAQVQIGRQITGENGQLLNEVLDANGQVLTRNGKRVYKDEAGNLVYADGSAVLDDSGSRLTVDSAGNIINEQGEKVDAFNMAETVSTGEVINIAGKRAESVLDANGNAMMVNGRKVYKDDAGNLVFADGSAVTDAKGQALRVNKDGHIIDSQGTILDPQTLAPAAQVQIGRQITGDNGQLLNEVLDANGQVLTRNGKRVYKDEAGNLVYADGSAVLDDSGSRLTVDSAGNIINEQGEKVDAFNMAETVSTGEVINIAGKRAESVLDANGNAMMVNGRKVYKDDAGNLVFADGSAVTDAKGQALRVNKDGHIIDSQGTILDPQTLAPAAQVQIGRQITGENGQLLNEVLDANGQVLARNGKRVYKDEAGNLVYADGSAVLDDSGSRLTVDSAGNIINEQGEKVDAFNMAETVSTGEVINIAGKRAESVLDANGNAMMVNGRKVYKDDAGNLVFADGSAVTDAKGQALRVNKDGHIIDSQGTILDPQTLAPAAQVQIARQITGDNGQLLNEVLDANGQVLTRNGKRVYKDEAGNLVYADGSAVLDDSGSRLTVDSAGNIINEQGEKVDAFNMAETVSTSDTAQGNIKYRGLETNTKGLKTTKDGVVVDENTRPISYKGEPVLNGLNSEVAIKGNKIIEKRTGNPVVSYLADANGKLISSKGEPLIKDAAQIGDSGFYIDENGNLMNKDGRGFYHNGKQVKVDPETGMLIYEDGMPVTDESGNRIFMGADGRLQDRLNGDPKISLLNSANGAVDLNGRDIDPSDFEVVGKYYRDPTSGQLFDKNGKPIKISGKRAFSINGKIVDSNGRHLTYRGQKLFLHPSGDIVGNNQQVVDAVQENKPRPKPQSNTKVGNSSIKTESDSKNKNTDESISQPQSNHSDDKSKQEVPNTDSNHKVKIVTKGATSSDIKRINERYKELELLINDEFKNVSSISKKVYASSSVSYATEKTNSNSVEANSPMESSEKNESVSPEGKKEIGRAHV